MKKRRSYNIANQAHEITCSCYHRLPLLARDRSRRWLVASIEHVRVQHSVDIWAYVIMPEHFHILLRPRRPKYRMPDILKSLKQPVARRALAWLRDHDPAWLDQLRGERAGLRRRHHFWQPGGGYDRNVVTESTALKIVSYIHANPVRRGLVDSPTQWRWSSAGWFAGELDVPLDMDPVRIA